MVSRFVNASILGGAGLPSLSAPAADGAPMGVPGENGNWPMLKLQYRSDPERIASILPPGIEPGDEPNVYITFYNVPINNEPEYGTVLSVEAKYKGQKGEYTISFAISQEDPVILCQELWGQPKYLAHTDYFRLGDYVEAKVCHHGYTYLEFRGKVKGVMPNPPDFTENNWWVKKTRSVTMQPGKYDFPPHVVHVRSVYGTAYKEKVEGQLVLRDSPWDPVAEMLPIRGEVSAYLWTPIFKDRGITLADPLDPEAFWPFADTIGGSRWPGHHGGPKKNHE